MVIITSIYVVATILMCIYNGRAARAAKEQTEVARLQTLEIIEQFKATNRPIITIRFEIIRSGLLCFVIENEGTLPARDVEISFNKEFIENIDNSSDMIRLKELNEAKLFIASRQKLTVLLGGQLEFERIASVPAKIKIDYNGIYREYTEIDLNQYRFMIVYDSSMEDISQHLKKMKENAERYYKNMLKFLSGQEAVKNVVLLKEEEKKFEIYKMICMEPRLNALQISEKLEMDKKEILELLIELKKVNKLIDKVHVKEVNSEYEIPWIKV